MAEAVRPPIPARRCSLVEFARAMLTADEAFRQRATSFEERFGALDDDGLALLAQASYYCWFEAEYEADLYALLRAIAQGCPTRLYLCGQVSPRRWDALHAIVVAVQRWLGREAPLPPGVDGHAVAALRGLLGPADAARRALAQLYLARLIGTYLGDVSLATLAGRGDTSPDGATYADYAAWYEAPGGRSYLHANDPDEFAAYVERASRALATAGAPADALLPGLQRASQPPCMHRFVRYQVRQLAAIGQLAWPGDPPPDDGSRARWQLFWEDATAALHAWLEDEAAHGALAQRMQALLGPPDRRKAVLVRECLLQPPPGTACFDWLGSWARAHGALVRQACRP